MSGFKVEFSVLNLQETPGIYASSLATRPAAGQVGRVFIDTDNPSTGIYRDTGTAWVQISNGGTGGGTFQTVTDAGKTTTNDISVGHSGAPVSTVDIRKATAALNNASDWTLTANNTPTITAGASFGVNYVNALYGFQGLIFAGSATIGNAGLNSAGNFINRLGSTGAGTITVTQASTIRAIAGTHSGIYFNTAAASTFTHVAAIQTLQPINQGAAGATVTNYYGVQIGDSTPSSGTVTYTNRWGIYQEGANDNNYFAGKILVNTTTVGSFNLDVNGTARIQGATTFVVGSNTSSIQNNTIDATQATFYLGIATPSGTNYTVKKNVSGATFINASTGQGIAIRVGDVDIVQISGSTTLNQIKIDFAANNNILLGQYEIQAFNRTGGSAKDFHINNGATLGSFFIDGDTNSVGLGTTTPSARLTIVPSNNTGGILASGSSLTGANAQNFVDLAQTWNTTGNPTLIKANVTNTASGATSRLLDLQVGGTSEFFVTKNGDVGVNTASNDASAIFQIDSTTKGVLLPRMTDTQITGITTPANGLMVYSTTQNCPAFYDGTGWRKVSHSAL